MEPVRKRNHMNHCHVLSWYFVRLTSSMLLPQCFLLECVSRVCMEEGWMNGWGDGWVGGGWMGGGGNWWVGGGCLFVGCLMSQQHASVSQRRICSDNFTCCNNDTEVANPTFHLTQSQYTDTGPTSSSTYPITQGAWQGSHWSASF